MSMICSRDGMRGLFAGLPDSIAAWAIALSLLSYVSLSGMRTCILGIPQVLLRSSSQSTNAFAASESMELLGTISSFRATSA